MQYNNINFYLSFYGEGGGDNRQNGRNRRNGQKNWIKTMSICLSALSVLSVQSVLSYTVDSLFFVVNYSFIAEQIKRSEKNIHER